MSGVLFFFSRINTKNAIMMKGQILFIVVDISQKSFIIKATGAANESVCHFGQQSDGEIF